MSVMIVGGGIGGLATALSLHAVGIASVVFEQRSQIRELGVGINTLPHEIEVLAQLGPEAIRTGHPLEPARPPGRPAAAGARSVHLDRAGPSGADSGDCESLPRWCHGRVTLLNRCGGPERVIDLVESGAPQCFTHIAAVASPAELAAIVRGYAQAAGFAAPSVRR